MEDVIIAGTAQIVDGDTLELQGERIRILYIDAPESRQTCMRSDGVIVQCGQLATVGLTGWIGMQRVTCDPFARD